MVFVISNQIFEPLKYLLPPLFLHLLPPSWVKHRAGHCFDDCEQKKVENLPENITWARRQEKKEEPFIKFYLFIKNKNRITQQHKHESGGIFMSFSCDEDASSETGLMLQMYCNTGRRVAQWSGRKGKKIRERGSCHPWKTASLFNVHFRADWIGGCSTVTVNGAVSN